MARSAALEGRWPGHEPGKKEACDDLSLGCESRPVLVRAEDGAPPRPWVFLAECVPFDVAPEWAPRPKRGCKCVTLRKGLGRCGDGCSSGCCAKGPRDHQHECHHGCECAERKEAQRVCDNRKLQQGQAKKLVLQKVEGKGWGVFADEPIKEGEFVVEYVGEYISAAEAERRSTLSPVAGEYMMELPGRGNGGGKAGVVTIDAFAMRNIAACINFSCDPNLTMDPVTAAHGDAAFPRVGFFAKRDIGPGDELGYRRDKNAISNAKRVGDCRCGAPRCSGNY
eukprot:Transcript_17001.p6 GENE.Transcript_17001~~Transcript_17001.p6  ORF type:complete len:281 (+),score=105.30 Transcript_17001:3999-4841(+)